MKIRVLSVLLALLFASTSFAQNQGDDTPLGSGGTKILCNVNTSLTAKASNGKLNFVACDTKGAIYNVPTDPSSGLTQSVIPVSNATSLNGVGAVGVGYSYVVADTVEAGSTTTLINATAHSARVGDILSFRSGTAGNIGVWSNVSAVAVNSITLANALPATPAAADGFYILRPAPLSVTTNLASTYNSLNVQVSSDGQSTTSTGILKLEDAAHTSGDAGVMALGIQNSTFSTLNADLDYGPFAMGRAGNIYQTLVTDDQLPYTRQAVIPEDIAFPASGALVPAGAVNNRNNAAFNSTNGDATPFGVTDEGGLFVAPTYSASIGGLGATRLEDQAYGTAEGLIVAGYQALSAIAQSVGTSGDLAPASMDLGNRLVTTMAPAGETVFGCNTAITTATTGTVIAAVASKYTFVTSWDCTNTGATATRVILEDGAGNDLANGFLPATSGYFNQGFVSIPTKNASVNQVVQVNVITSGSSTICCARGYVGVI